MSHRTASVTVRDDESSGPRAQDRQQQRKICCRVRMKSKHSHLPRVAVGISLHEGNGWRCRAMSYEFPISISAAPNASFTRAAVGSLLVGRGRMLLLQTMKTICTGAD